MTGSLTSLDEILSKTGKLPPARGDVEDRPEEVVFLHNDTIDLIMSVGPSDLCFAEPDDHPTEDRMKSLEFKTTLNSSLELNKEPGLDLTPTDPGELEPLSGGVVGTPSMLGSYFQIWIKTRSWQTKKKQCVMSSTRQYERRATNRKGEKV